MLDYDTAYDYGEEGNFIYTVCEIPKNSTLKVEFDRDKKTFVLDRVEPGIFAKPVNYGFIPKTTDEDGDALDSLIITDEPLPTGLVVKAKVVALLDFTDGGDADHKIVCVPEDDRNAGPVVNNLSDLPDTWKKQVEHHFNHYKDLKQPGTTKVNGWGDADDAWAVIKDCSKRYRG
ncbi:MAG TPA: inorganic diphosphatase [Candidatus Saccharimonadales bacterium]|nr:inorganic diphosphatase [Candidatus Saccharimonadales bacterium]